jgi:hypothetical protein
MSNGRLELSYHPALKQIKFKRWENGGWTNIDSNKSILHKYIMDKSGIILQNLGNGFFNDLAKSMDGITEIAIDFRGTKLDHGDFKSMIGYYNSQNKDVSFSIGEFAELIDMESLYQDIKVFSNETIMTLDTASKNEVLGDFRQDIKKYNTELKDKKGKLDDNTVNLCFVGAYSSGKSTLINAIFGYEILPEALKSETAKMFRISHVKDYDSSGISFVIGTEHVELRWEKNTFCLYTEIQESKIRTRIQECININCDKPLHVQLRLILTEINKQPNSPSKTSGEYINGIIDVCFPIPICGDVSFTIYDTPGTDSNYSEHLSILKKALEEQTNSILIFVNRPTKLEGTGNSMLIQLLNNIAENASKSTIDIGRSLYIINAADEIMKGEDGFKEVKNGEIKLLEKPQEETTGNETENNVKKIPLNDKRLFFICARAAYVARANMNNIATDVDNEDKAGLKYKVVDSPNAGYYQYNNMALSEHNTKEMIKEARQAAERVKDNVDELFVVNSGLYSLENEIKKYGSKFAMAVKAKSIIDAVQFIIDTFESKVTVLESDKERNKAELEEKIKVLRETLTSQIKKTLADFKNAEKIHEDDDIPSSTLTRLTLSDNARDELMKRIAEEVKGIWWLGFTGEWSEDGSKKALQNINLYFKDYYSEYNNISKRVIKEGIDRLNDKIKTLINDCKDIDDETKNRLLLIPNVETGEAPDISGKVDVEKHLKAFLFFKKLDKNSYRDDVEKEAFKILDQAQNKFKNDYKKRLREKCDAVCENYLNNIDIYSRELERLINDKESVERELEQLNCLLGEIKEKKETLVDKIWREKNGQLL